MSVRSLRCPLLCRRGVEDAVAEAPQVATTGYDSEETKRPGAGERSSMRVNFGTALLMAVVSAALSAFATSKIHQRAAAIDASAVSSQTLSAIPDGQTLAAEALFKELSTSEVRTVSRFAASKLGCDTAYVSLSRCFLTGAEAVALKLPSKAASLAHLDRGAPRPPRTAQVMVAHGERPVSEGLAMYEVGPLDGTGGLADDASVTLVKSLHWNYRPLQMDDSSPDVAVTRAMEQMQNLLISTFGPIFPYLKASYNPAAGTCVYWTGANVFSSLGRRSSRFWFNWFKDPNEFQLSWLHTLPFNFDMSHEGPPESWRAVNVSYCGQRFATVDDLLAAEAKGKVWRCDAKQRTGYGWDVPGPHPAATGRLPTPPTSLSASSQRTWSASPGGSIRWGDWSLLATLRPSSGLALHDVRYRGDRILYELSLSDCHAYYAGPTPEKQYHFSDKAYSMAQISGDMVEGLDCPVGASFLQSAMWIRFFGNGTSRSDPSQAHGFKLACVFESNGYEGSSWRHTQLLNRQATGRPKRMLVIRAIGTVGNYDYITEVFLGEDGGIQVREAFAGYPEIDRTFEVSRPPNWGVIVQSEGGPRGHLVQNLHSHYCAFKVDLDILGTANEFKVTKLKHQGAVGPGSVGQKIQETQRVSIEDPNMELVATAHAPGIWHVVNAEARNRRNGAPRGYAVVVGSAPSVHGYSTSHPFAASATFARRHVAVAKRKEEEPTATSVVDFYPVTDPLLSVDRFLSDRESLVGEDLVCWVSIGKEHVARAEDQPLISNFAVDFSLLPWNYHEQNPEMVLAMAGKGPEAWISASELRR